MTYAAFAPVPGGAKVVSASGTTTETFMGAAPAIGSWQCRAYNATAVVAFVRAGEGDATTTTDMPIAAGGVEVFTVSSTQYVNVILASSTGNVYLTVGSGY